MSQIKRKSILCIPNINNTNYNIKQLTNDIPLKRQNKTIGLSKSGMYIEDNGNWYHIQRKCISNDSLQIKNKPVYANYIEEKKGTIYHLPLDMIRLKKTSYIFKNQLIELELEERNETYSHENKSFPNKYSETQKWNVYIHLKSDYHDLNIKETDEISRVLTLINYI